MFGTRARAVVIAGVVVATLAPLSGPAGAVDGDPAQVGQFTAPFEEAGGKCVHRRRRS